MTEPVGALVTTTDDVSRVEAPGDSFVIREWWGSGPAELHVHHADDEAWHDAKRAVYASHESEMLE
ncbi:MAG: hypothetical protein WCB51_14085 [Candidatus Dormiibacterota bacterium]